MQYITTRYHPATKTLPERVSARQSFGPHKAWAYVTDTVLRAELKAVDELRKKLRWDTMYRAGTSDKGNVWCFPPAVHEARPAGCYWVGETF